jgi:hypothetical protein
MDEKRKEIIIRELQYWKQSKLLPSHYCDYLLSLYTEGEYDHKDQGAGKAVWKQVRWFVAIMLFVFSILVIYFTNFSSYMQIGFASFSVAIIWLIAFKSKVYNIIMVQFTYFLAAILLFVVTVETMYLLPYTSKLWIGAVIFSHCLIWLAYGWRQKLFYFLIAGGAGFILLVFIMIT